MEPAGLGWLDGFNELLCRCGLESNGPPEFDDAGRAAASAARPHRQPAGHRVELIVDEDAGQLTLRGVVDETRFHFQSLRLTTSITTTIGSNEFSWTDEVENIGGRDATMQMLYHFNIGQPLLRPGARITAPVGTVAPLTQVAARGGHRDVEHHAAAAPGSAEQVFVPGPAGRRCRRHARARQRPDRRRSRQPAFNKRTLPCFTVWRNTPAEVDGYVLGIEPGTNYPEPALVRKTAWPRRNAQARRSLAR